MELHEGDIRACIHSLQLLSHNAGVEGMEAAALRREKGKTTRITLNQVKAMLNAKDQNLSDFDIVSEIFKRAPTGESDTTPEFTRVSTLIASAASGGDGSRLVDIVYENYPRVRS